MNELTQSIGNIDLAVNQTEGDVLCSYLEYALKVDELEENSDAFVQEGLIDKGLDKLAEADVSYRDFSIVTRILMTGLLAGVGSVTLKLLSKCGTLGQAIANSTSGGGNGIGSGLAGIGGGIISGMICSKYRKKVINKELMKKINYLINHLTTKETDDGNEQHIFTEKMKTLRRLINAIQDDLEFALSKDVIDSSLTGTYRTFQQACLKFYRYTNNERLLNIYRDEETEKRKMTGKKKAKAANARQFAEFVKALYSFLEKINGELDKKPSPGEEAGEESDKAGNATDDEKKDQD